MLNQVVIVGRLVNNVKVETAEDGKEFSTITLAVSRPFKNKEGIYEIDFIDCTLWAGIAKNAAEYCRKGDLVGVRGRIESKKEDDKRILYINADKITFLSSKKPEAGDDLSA